MSLTKQEQRALEHDPFLDSMTDSVGYVQQNRQKMLQIGGVVLALLLAGAAAFYYFDSQKEMRQSALQAAFAVHDAPVTDTPQAFTRTFTNQVDKDRESNKAFADVIAKYDGTEEGAIAHYYLGVDAADKGDLAKARAELSKTESQGGEDIRSLAQLAMADVLVAENKVTEAEALLQKLVDKPSSLVSKEQATIALARLVARRDVAKAKAMLEPLREKSSAISRSAVAVIGEISAANAK